MQNQTTGPRTSFSCTTNLAQFHHAQTRRRRRILSWPAYFRMKRSSGASGEAAPAAAANESRAAESTPSAAELAMPMATLAVDAGAPLAQASSSSGRRVSFAPPRAAPTRTPRHSATHTEAVGGRELASANGLTRVRWATCNIVGQRDEDCVSLHGANRGDKGALACFGVFDGHGGMDAARTPRSAFWRAWPTRARTRASRRATSSSCARSPSPTKRSARSPVTAAARRSVSCGRADARRERAHHVRVGDSAALALVPTGVRPDSLVGPKFRCLSWARTPGAAAHPQQPHQLVHLASSSAHSAETARSGSASSEPPRRSSLAWARRSRPRPAGSRPRSRPRE